MHVLLTRTKAANRFSLLVGGGICTNSAALRWRPTLVAPLLSGGRWRKGGFLSKDMDFELPLLTMSFLSPVALTIIMSTLHQSCLGILPRSLGNLRAIFPLQEVVTQQLLFHIRSYNQSVWRCFSHNSWN